MFPTQNATKHYKREYFTLIMIVCDDKNIQKRLPQVLVVGDNLISQDEFISLQDVLPDTVYVKRRGKGWNTSAIMVEYMTLLAAILAPYIASIRFVLTYDAVPCHLDAAVLAAIGASDLFWFLVIPAKLTWLLQPLDVYGFSILKQRMKARYIMKIIEGNVMKPAVRMILILFEILQPMLDSVPWARAFRRTGYAVNRNMVSNFIKKHLQVDVIPALPSSAPSEVTLGLCWPSNRIVRYADIACAQPPLPIGLHAMPGVVPIAAILAADPAAEPAAVAVPPLHEAALAVPPVLLRRLNTKQSVPGA